MTKYRTRDGYSVEVVQLAGTPGNHDGQWLRVRYHGYYVADVRTVTALEKYFPLSELEEALPRPDFGGPRLGERRKRTGVQSDTACCPANALR